MVFNRKEYNKKYYGNNKDKAKQYRENNKNKIKIKGKEYYENNKDKIKIKGKQYRENNKNQIKQYYENNKNQIKKNYEKSKKNICIVCGKSAYDKFCSLKCMGINRTGENCYMWQGGKSFEPYPITWTLRFKKSIRDRDNNRCMRCGRAREEFNRALDVHHINAIKENTYPENCISLCIRCHNLTKGKEEFFAEGFYSMLKRCYGYE